jgi:SWI/SNF-related matrix-associated actin-dependent regulator of chromatin subfamily A3
MAPAYQYSPRTTDVSSSSDFFEWRPSKRRRLTQEPSGHASNDTWLSCQEKSSAEVGQQCGLRQAVEERPDTPASSGQVVSQHASAADIYCKTSDDSMNEEVCFGMLVDIEAVQVMNDLCYDVNKLLWVDEITLKSAATGAKTLKLSERTFDLMHQLAVHGGVTFQILQQQCATGGIHGPARIELRKAAVSPAVRLNVVLYGPKRVSTNVGDFLQECEQYLQQPEGCDRNVRYVNPHCLSADDEAEVMTFELGTIMSKTENESLNQDVDVLAYLNSEEVLEEADQPLCVRTPLKSHQKEALSFMLAREQGWCLDGTRADVWKAYCDSHGTTRYRNCLTGHSQLEAPPPFRGGIIADEMGLGKTLSVLSLIASNPAIPHTPASVETNTRFIKATLIVVPFSLLQGWESQIRTHFQPSSIHSIVYHGTRRQTLLSRLHQFDIILTTYNTISTEWNRYKFSPQDVAKASLFSLQWHRIVIDEAHTIRTKHSLNSKTVCSLRSIHRWCITGTPIQNRLSDLHSLFRFLRVHPFDDAKVFENEILQPWRNEVEERAIEKLQALVRMITIRRPSSVISLPSRTEEIQFVHFDAQELAAYEQARSGTLQVIEIALSEKTASGNGYVNAFRRINDLRLVCNHGTLFERRGKCELVGKSDITSHQIWSKDELEDLLFATDEVCLHCGTDLEEERQCTSSLSPSFGAENATENIRLCTVCSRRSGGDSSSSSLSRSSTSGSGVHEALLAPSSMPSKIRVLVGCLSKLPADEKCVVFSCWTRTLDIIEQALGAARMIFCRYDGRLSRARRNQVLRSFATDHSLRVILVSITCGGQGLDLTAANHAVLIEPQWNPMLEEQALSRIHRLGQTKPVTMTRLIVKNTWEEKVITAQERKKFLADLITNRKPLKGGEHGKRQLMVRKFTQSRP